MSNRRGERTGTGKGKGADGETQRTLFLLGRGKRGRCRASGRGSTHGGCPSAEASLSCQASGVWGRPSDYGFSFISAQLSEELMAVTMVICDGTCEDPLVRPDRICAVTCVMVS